MKRQGTHQREVNSQPAVGDSGRPTIETPLMKQAWRDILLLFILTLIVRLIVAGLIDGPGYMDVAYYTSGAIRLAEGHGFQEPFIWNYLDRPAGIPRPGFLYWMPMPSILAAPFAALLPGSFFALQIPFALLSALLPPLTYGFAWRTLNRRQTAWLAGLLILFSGLFFPYWTVPETFTPFALFGALALWLAGTDHPDTRVRNLRVLLAGGLVGLAHLTRADGFLILPVAGLVAFISQKNGGVGPSREHPAPDTLRFRLSRSTPILLSLLVLGYLLAMAPWFLRNLIAIGTPLSSAGTQTLWLRDYNDLFCYECDLSLDTYLAWGWPNILRSKSWAVKVNLQRFLAEDCLIFLLPFTLLGLYRLRRRLPFLLATVYLIVLFLVHSLAFTFPGPRGGFFHASTAILPFLHIAAAEALHSVIRWAGRRRRWPVRQSQAVFSVATVVLALILSVYAMAGRQATRPDLQSLYSGIHERILEEDPEEATVMVGNPPAFWYATRQPALMVPNADLETVLDVCERYDVGYLILDHNHPPPLGDVYEGRVSSPRLTPIPIPFTGLALWRIEP